MSGRTTRRRALAQKEASASLATAVMSCSDICRLLLPTLPFGAFVSLRCSCAGIYRATQAVCEELVAILERAALLYVSPRFGEALALMGAHQPHLSWLIQTPALAVVTCDRYDEVIAGAYHLLQAHLTRMQKLAVSNVLRRAASRPRGSALRRCRLLHMGVRLGMFTESARQLRALHRAAEQAVEGIEAHYAAEPPPGGGQPANTAAAHYTIAGFYTYHHRPRNGVELGDALKKAQGPAPKPKPKPKPKPNPSPKPNPHPKQAQGHLQRALAIQSRQLGQLHIATLCTQLVKAQVHTSPYLPISRHISPYPARQGAGDAHARQHGPIPNPSPHPNPNPNPNPNPHPNPTPKQGDAYARQHGGLRPPPRQAAGTTARP